MSRVRTQLEINQSHTVRERLLATLALFFAIVALLLAGVGLYGVLHYSVQQRRREIGIRMAVGAQAGGVARLVTMDVFAMVLVGASAGIGLGMIVGTICGVAVLSGESNRLADAGASVRWRFLRVRCWRRCGQ